MKTEEFFLKGSEFIELIKLLKAMNICDSGGSAKAMVDEELVKVNGEITTVKRLKLKPNDVVEVSNLKIIIKD